MEKHGSDLVPFPPVLRLAPDTVRTGSGGKPGVISVSRFLFSTDKLRTVVLRLFFGDRGSRGNMVPNFVSYCRAKPFNVEYSILGLSYGFSPLLNIFTAVRQYLYEIYQNTPIETPPLLQFPDQDIIRSWSRGLRAQSEAPWLALRITKGGDSCVYSRKLSGVPSYVGRHCAPEQACSIRDLELLSRSWSRS